MNFHFDIDTFPAAELVLYNSYLSIFKCFFKCSDINIGKRLLWSLQCTVFVF